MSEFIENLRFGYEPFPTPGEEHGFEPEPQEPEEKNVSVNQEEGEQ